MPPVLSEGEAFSPESRGEMVDSNGSNSSRVETRLLQVESPPSLEVTMPQKRNTRRADILWSCSIACMLAWPWVLFGVVLYRGGTQLTPKLSRFVLEHPHTVNFIITLFANVDCLIIDLLFSVAIIRLAQEWIAVNDVTVFQVSLFSALRHQNWPWSVNDLKGLCTRNRWFPAVLVGISIGSFAFIPPGITSLISPVSYNQTVNLAGAELDLLSGASDCLDWLKDNRISRDCDWMVVQDLSYTACLGYTQQLLDMLESGRGRILALLSKDAERPVFNQLGDKGGIRFSAPIRGVLPIGPNGIRALNTLQPSPLSDTQAMSQMISYNYTLEHQGLNMNVTCAYDSESPIAFLPVIEPSYVLQYNGTCLRGEAEVLTDVQTFVSLKSNNTLAFWACKSPAALAQEPTYLVYLRGASNYANSIGNISCEVSPRVPKISVTYQSRSGMFSTSELLETAESLENTKLATTFSYGSMEAMLLGLGSMVWQFQNWQANLLAETVTDLGTRSFNLSASEKSPTYLRLYEAMIQGILEYEATYVRLIYSTHNDLPPSCLRTVNGFVTYQVVGLFAKPEHVGFLMPMTIVGLASLGVMAQVLYMSEGTACDFDPTGERSLLLATQHPDNNDAEGSRDFEHRVTYPHRVAIQEAGERMVDRTQVSEMVVAGLAKIVEG